jgi:hypothetical protein
MGNSVAPIMTTLELAIGGALSGNYELTKQAFSSWASMSMLREAGMYALRAAKTADNQLLPDSRAFDDGRADSITPEAFGLQKMQGPLREGEAFKGDKLYNTVDMIGKFLRLPSRLLMTSDEFFKQLNYRRAARLKLAMDGTQKLGISDPHELAKHIEEGMKNIVDSGGRYYSEESFIREGTKLADQQGIKGVEERSAFISDHVSKNFDEEKSALAQFAKDEAEYHTFTNELEKGSIGRGVQDLVRNSPILSFVMPFVRTPTNLLSFAFERFFPYQIGKALLIPSYRKELFQQFKSPDPIIRSKALGKLVTSTVMSGLLVDGLNNSRDFVTGGGPKDENQKKALEATGWRPYSFKVGDKYISYQRLDPLSTIIGTYADMIEIGTKYPQGFQADPLDEVFAAVTISMTRNITNKSYLSGLNTVLSALSDPERNFARLARNYAGSAVPMSGFLGQSQSAQGDQEARELRSMMEAIKNKIPGLRSGLDPKRNLLGEEIIIENLPLVGAINPIAHSDIKNDPVLNEMANLQHGFKNPSSTYNGLIDLLKYENGKGQTAHDRRMEKLKEIRINGKTLRQALERLIKSRAYQRMSSIAEPGLPSPRVQMLNKILGKYRNKALDETIEEFPELSRFYDNVTRAKYQIKAGADVSDVLSLLNQ